MPERKAKKERPSEKRLGPPQGRDATSYDVARLAGVSQSAVSRTFRPGASVAPETRTRVLEAAARLSYQPNALAQALISKRTNLVAILISNLTNLYYPEVLAELGQRLSQNGIRTLLFALPNEGDAGEILNELWRHRVDGVIAAVKLQDDQIRAFQDKGVALVLYNRIADGGMASSVCCDSAAGEKLLVDRLVAAGHTNFGIIAGPEDSYVGEERLHGALSALEKAGFDNVPSVRGDFSYESGAKALGELLDQKKQIDAIICANDMMAIGALDAARDLHGLAIPRDLSVVGFDGIDPAHWTSYRLTSIRQPVRRMTEATVQMLMERIEDPDTEHERRLFAGQLLEGSSARLA